MRFLTPGALRRALLAIAAIALTTATCYATTLTDIARLGVVDPVRGRVYTSGTDGNMRVIDGATLQSSSYPVPVSGSIVVNAVTNKAYISATNGVVEFDGETHVARMIPLSGTPVALAMNIATNKLYAAQSAARLSVFDAATRVVKDVLLAAPATGIGINPATNRVYLAGSPVQVLDGATDSVTPAPVTANSSTVLVNSSTNKVFLLSADTYGTLAAMDGDSLAVTGVATPGNVFGLALNPLTDRLYAGTGGSGNVSATLAIIDGSTFARIDINTANPNQMSGLAVNTTTNRIHAAAPAICTTVCPPGTSLTVDGATNAVAAGAMQAHDMAVDPLANRLYGWTRTAGPLALIINTWQAVDIAVTPAPSISSPPSTAITPLTNDTAGTSTPHFTFTTSAGVGGMPALAVFFSVDSASGPWTRAQGTAPRFDARTAALADGAHTLYAFAVDATVSGFSEAHGTSVVGHMASYGFTVANGCASIACADLSIEHTTAPASGFTGKDALYRLKVTNWGPSAATQVVVSEKLPLGTAYIWASPGCQHHFFTFPEGLRMYVWCTIDSLAPGASAEVTLVIRPSAAGTVTTTASASATELDPQADDNSSTANVPVTDPPPANIVPRYRLYSPVTLEHHYTMDANEYAVLGANGNWVQEGQVGNVLDNPGSYNGVQAVPYYRLYNTVVRWHHWTADPNEYYTLITYPGWNGEDVSGYIFPTQAPGTTQLYRLTYPFVPGLHHWTIDANEYSVLTSTYGWVGEGGSGFVIQ